mgnify:CR=1 FL=1
MARGKYHDWITKEGLLKIEGWARDGLTDEQIAKNIGIRRETLYAWKKKYPNISNSLKKGKEVVDREVENALLKKALGYRYEEVTKEVMENPQTGRMSLAVTKIVTKEVIPDTTAQIFWLKNRKPDAWRDKKDIDAKLSTANPLEDLTTEEIRQLIADED